MNKRVLPFATLLIFFSIITHAQDEGVRPDRWRGLVIDQSSPDDAIKLLGTPAKDKLTSLTTHSVEQWVSKKRKEKIFRTLEYKKPTEAVEKAWLSFLDNKLVSILLDMKEGTVSPNALSNIYGVEFRPIIGRADLAFSPRDFERHEGKIYPKTYPTVYHLAAVSEKTMLTAMIGNVPSLAGAFGRSMGVPDKPDSFPGKVMFVQLISRTLENRDGADALR